MVLENIEGIAELKEMIDESSKIVFFGGAGVSTESGIPDFRSKDGLYNQHDVKFDNYSPEYLLTRTSLSLRNSKSRTLRYVLDAPRLRKSAQRRAL